MKNLILRGGGGGVTKNKYSGRGLPKKRRLGQFADLTGSLGKKKGWCFCV